jgi:hypothetical protein
MMNKAVCIVSGIFLCLLALIVATSNAFAFQDYQENTISGTVIEVERNDQDEVTAVAIEINIETASKEGVSEKATEKYLVGDTVKGHELHKLIGKRVQATGLIKTDDNGDKTILVTKFTLTEPEKSDQEPKQETP